MKIDINHVEKSTGLIRKKNLHGVTIHVRFSQEEMAIIQERKLKNTLLLERDTPADVNVDKHANKGMTSKLLKAATQGMDPLSFDLALTKLVNGPDTHWMDTPLDAKAYEQELIDMLPTLKSYVDENAGVDEKSKSFEL